MSISAVLIRRSHDHSISTAFTPHWGEVRGNETHKFSRTIQLNLT